MILPKSLFMPSFNRTYPSLSLFRKFPLLSALQGSFHSIRPSFLHYHTYLFVKPHTNIQGYRLHMDGRARFCNMVSATSSFKRKAHRESNKAKRKAQRESPEGVLKGKLDLCSKHGDLVEALRLYDEALSNGVHLNQYHYNVLLYLCSSSSPVESNRDGKENASNLALQRGFEIFQQMVINNVKPNEATFTNAARLAAALEDPEMAFDLVKQMKSFDIPPRLRSYGPALFGFCKKDMADRAYEVDSHMTECQVMAEEPELSALLKVSAEGKRADKVYEMLHRLRATVRQVSESTMKVTEDWFTSDDARKTGTANLELNKIRESVINGGGGWHGQGWLGSGPWKVSRTKIDEKGACQSCGEILACIDIDPRETENFAYSLSNLACQREVKTDFIRFQEWLERPGPFESVIDGANVSLINQQTFSFNQLNTVVKRLSQMNPSKRLPLVILHKNRVNGGPAQNPSNRKLLEHWKKAGALYATPSGSNDDWYWLYAAVSNKCLLVTNDEMRDHLFQLLGTSFFPRWKEKHQVRLSVSRENGIQLHMPPPYSIVIQESENGSWHIPTIQDDDLTTPREWLCATRAKSSSQSAESRRYTLLKEAFG